MFRSSSTTVTGRARQQLTSLCLQRRALSQFLRTGPSVVLPSALFLAPRGLAPPRTNCRVGQQLRQYHTTHCTLAPPREEEGNAAAGVRKPLVELITKITSALERQSPSGRPPQEQQHTTSTSAEDRLQANKQALKVLQSVAAVLLQGNVIDTSAAVEKGEATAESQEAEQNTAQQRSVTVPEEMQSFEGLAALTKLLTVVLGGGGDSITPPTVSSCSSSALLWTPRSAATRPVEPTASSSSSDSDGATQTELRDSDLSVGLALWELWTCLERCEESMPWNHKNEADTDTDSADASLAMAVEEVCFLACKIQLLCLMLRSYAVEATNVPVSMMTEQTLPGGGGDGLGAGDEQPKKNIKEDSSEDSDKSPKVPKGTTGSTSSTLADDTVAPCETVLLTAVHEASIQLAEALNFIGGQHPQQSMRYQPLLRSVILAVLRLLLLDEYSTTLRPIFAPRAPVESTEPTNTNSNTNSGTDEAAEKEGKEEDEQAAASLRAAVGCLFEHALAACSSSFSSSSSSSLQGAPAVVEQPNPTELAVLVLTYAQLIAAVLGREKSLDSQRVQWTVSLSHLLRTSLQQQEKISSESPLASREANTVGHASSVAETMTKGLFVPLSYVKKKVKKDADTKSKLATGDVQASLSGEGSRTSSDLVGQEGFDETFTATRSTGTDADDDEVEQEAVAVASQWLGTFDEVRNGGDEGDVDGIASVHTDHGTSEFTPFAVAFRTLPLLKVPYVASALRSVTDGLSSSDDTDTGGGVSKDWDFSTLSEACTGLVLLAEAYDTCGAEELWETVALHHARVTKERTATGSDTDDSAEESTKSTSKKDDDGPRELEAHEVHWSASPLGSVLETAVVLQETTVELMARHGAAFALLVPSEKEKKEKDDTNSSVNPQDLTRFWTKEQRRDIGTVAFGFRKIDKTLANQPPAGAAWARGEISRRFSGLLTTAETLGVIPAAAPAPKHPPPTPGTNTGKLEEGREDTGTS